MMGARKRVRIRRAVPESQADLARMFFDSIQERYEDYKRAADENQLPVMRYFTPAGQMVQVLNVKLDRDKGVSWLQGETKSRTTSDLVACDVLVKPQSCQLLLELLTFAEPQPEQERPQIGFVR
jgi:hypothetical protein